MKSNPFDTLHKRQQINSRKIFTGKLLVQLPFSVQFPSWNGPVMGGPSQLYGGL